MDKLTAVIVPVEKPAYVAQIDNSLEAMQDLVGGYIETVFVEDTGNLFGGTCIVCNEEGRILELPPNKLGFVGQFFIISNTIIGDGEMTGLDENHANLIASVLNEMG